MRPISKTADDNGAQCKASFLSPGLHISLHNCFFSLCISSQKPGIRQCFHHRFLGRGNPETSVWMQPGLV